MKELNGMGSVDDRSSVSMGGLSNYDISAMKRLIKWQDEAARQENLVIRGIKLFGDWKVGVKRFIKENLAVDVNIVK